VPGVEPTGLFQLGRTSKWVPLHGGAVAGGVRCQGKWPIGLCHHSPGATMGHQGCSAWEKPLEEAGLCEWSGLALGIGGLCHF